MLDQTFFDLAATVLQRVYAEAGSTCIVLTEWPDRLDEPGSPLLILHELMETDGVVTAQLRGNPKQGGQVAWDILGAHYRLPAASEQPDQPTTVQAQQAARADKAILLNLFKPDSDGGPTLNGACIQAGQHVHVSHPRYGPYDPHEPDVVRFCWDAEITIHAHNH